MHTATGLDGILAHLIKCLGTDSKEQLSGFFTTMLDGTEIQRKWRLGGVESDPRERE